MYPSFTPQYFDKAERLRKMNDEFVTILTPVDLHYDMNLNEIVLSVTYGILEDHNFFNIIHKYDFEISKIIYNEHKLTSHLAELLIILEDRKEYT